MTIPRMPKRQALRMRHNEVLNDLTKGLEESMEYQRLETEILRRKFDRRKERKAAARAKARGTKPIRTLVADKGDKVYDMAKSELGKINGTTFEVTRAISCEQVYSAIQDNRFDVILIDCESFAKEGQQASELIKTSKKESKHAAIIVYGPEGDYCCDMMAMEAGASDYLGKDELTAKRLEKSIRYCLCNRA